MKNPRQIALVALMLAIMANSSYARFAIRPAAVPVDRLIANTQKHIKANPDDPQGYYVLGRLHSMAFATEKKEITIGRSFRQQPNDAEALPSFLPYESIKAKPNSNKPEWMLSAERIWHLQQSLANYQMALGKTVKLDKAPKPGKPAPRPRWSDRDTSRVMLGIAWMYEVAAQQKDAIDAWMKENKLESLPADDAKAVTAFLAEGANWKSKAVQAYQGVFSAVAKQDKANPFSGPGADSLLSIDAANSLIRIIGEATTEKEKATLVQMQAHLKDMSQVARAVTPIIFSLAPSRRVDELVQSQNIVSFDLDGDGVKSNWPWLKRDTFFLTWDPKQTGKIKDGRQLFGSSTWWIYWNHGYEPLAALDNDGNGWLERDELMGLAGWQDRNSNGVSDPGEVTPVTRLGIKRIAASPSMRSRGIAEHERGLELSNGQSLPTYDWTPSSIPAK